MFSLEFKMELPTSVGSAAWSTDNRILVTVPRGLPFLNLINVEQRQQHEWTTPFPFEFRSVAISPDGRLLALFQPTRLFRGLWLYSISHRKSIAKVELPFDGCFPFVLTPGGLAFAPDGSGLWVGCVGPRLAGGGYSAAVKLGLTDLKIRDRAVFPPLPSSRNAKAQPRANRLSIHEGNVIWAQVVAAPDPLSPKKRLHYVRAIDLATKEAVFAPFKIKTRPGRPTLLQSVFVSPQENIAVVSRRHFKQMPPAPAGTPDFAFETYDSRTGRLVAEFWSKKDQEDPERGGQVNHAALIPDSTYVVGAMDTVLNPQKHGGLIVWNARTGAVIQRIRSPSAHHVSVSGNGKRIALLAGRLLFMYRRNP